MVDSVNVSIECGLARICLRTHLDECVGFKSSYDFTDELFRSRECQVVVFGCARAYFATDESKPDHALDFF